MVQNTCKKKECKQWDKGRCPFYAVTNWTNPMSGETGNTDDCAPVRSLIMIQELSNRLVGVEKSQESLRNETAWVQVVAEVLGRNSGVNLEEFVKQRQILENRERIKEIAGNKGK